LPDKKNLALYDMNQSNDKIIFSETQRFRQWWLLLMVSAPVIYSVYSLLDKFVFSPTEKDTTSIYGLLIGFIVNDLLLVMFLLVKLETTIEKETIAVRFFPFQLKSKAYRKDEISKLEIRKYKPIREYGGWGIRGSGDNRALNVLGTMGLQIEFTDGKRLLIGTQKPDELEAAIQSWKKS
jgi:hypothetical protein